MHKYEKDFSNFEYIPYSNLDDLKTDDVFCSILPYDSSNQGIQACTISNRALNLLSFGLPLAYADLKYLIKAPDTIIRKNITTNDYRQTLDFFYNNSDKIKQIDSFKVHIEASIQLDVPIIIHSRNAETETFDILNSYKSSNLKILMHCFTGSLSFAKKLMEFDTFFSASGIITFKNSVDLQETFREIPLEKLLIETDSPFLAPIPMRGKKNEPSFIKYTLEKISTIKSKTTEEMSILTTDNFNRLFNT